MDDPDPWDRREVAASYVTLLVEPSHDLFDPNATENVSTDWDLTNKVRVVLTSLLLGAIILTTIVGNVLVIASIVLERNLRNVANYLISSLAVADLMVAALVMPLAAVYEVGSRWFLGPELCDLWIAFDVLCCTSSILHLVAISVDRYWAVTQADYIHNRSSARMLVMVGLSWGASALISVPPMFGSRDPVTTNDPDRSGLCLISQDWTYTVFSTIGAFYLPLIVMTIIYLKIYDTARSRIRKRHFRRGRAFGASENNSTSGGPSKVVLLDETSLISDPAPYPPSPRPPPPTPPSTDPQHSPAVCETSSSVCILPKSDSTTTTTTITTTRYAHPLHQTQSQTPGSRRWERLRQHLRRGMNGSWMNRSQDGQGPGADDDATASAVADRKRRAKEKLEQKRERKAARTLAILTGTFVVCWLPFFIVALVRPFCGAACHYPRLLVSVIGWLGYFNSLLNPIIYTVFNPDFRSAFRKIIFGKYHRSVQNRRISLRLLRR